MTEPSEREALFSALQTALAGTWSLERELGRGGMGTVYLARDVALERPVAIKVLDPTMAKDPEQRQRFLQEARTGARLSHPHIVPIYAVEEAADSVYIVMGLVDGESLRERIMHDGPLSPSDALRLWKEVGWALGYAHAMGTLHRDVTLDNILIERRTGRAMLADFGIAAEIDREDAGPLLGTPAYIAPELIEGFPATPQSDLYALGITAWAMLSGRLPFQGEESGAVLLQQLTEPVPSLADAAPGTPSALVRAVHACLAKDPAARPASVEHWLAGLDGNAKEVALAGPLEKWVDQWRQVKAFYALALSVAAMIGGMVFRGGMGGPFWALLVELFGFAIPALAVGWLIHRMVELRLIRQAARAGYRIDDLRLALRRFLTPTLETNALSNSAQPLPPFTQRILRTLTSLALFLFLFVGTAWSFILLYREHYWTVNPSGPRPWMHFTPELNRYLSSVLQWSYVSFWTGASLRVLMPSQKTWLTRLQAKLRLAFWNSRDGDRIFKLASIGIGAMAVPEQTLHRPTELMLDLEIEDLCHALPANGQSQFAEMPALARSLRERVAQLKELYHSLDTPALASSTEVHRVRERLLERQEAGIAALERMRMMLVRLGIVAAPDGEFTEVLDDLRGVEAELLTELGAHDHIRLALTKGNRNRSLTPAQTPA